MGEIPCRAPTNLVFLVVVFKILLPGLAQAGLISEEYSVHKR